MKRELKAIIYGSLITIILLAAAGYTTISAARILKRQATWQKHDKTTYFEVQDTTEFADKVLALIFEMRIEHPYVVLAQARLESGNFNSQIFRENNNLFGMKMPWRRATFASGVNRGHAVYDSWEHSVYDYALWQSAYMRGLTQEQYLERLSGSYAEDRGYKQKLLTML